MDITAVGIAPNLSWLTQRLSAHGYTVIKGHLPATLLSNHPDINVLSYLLIDNCVISIGEHSSIALEWLVTQSSRHHLQYAELTGKWHPAGVQFGFMLFLGTTIETCTTLQALLDTLAPLPEAWLYCGPAGSASFTHRVFNALTCTSGLALQTEFDTRIPPLLQKGWVHTLMQQQQTLATQLLMLAETYLAHHPVSHSIDTNTSQTFHALPYLSKKHPHYAHALAELLVLALGATTGCSTSKN